MRETRHATDRIRQRHIAEAALRLVEDHGDWSADGARIRLDRKRIDRLIAERQRQLRQL